MLITFITSNKNKTLILGRISFCAVGIFLHSQAHCTQPSAPDRAKTSFSKEMEDLEDHLDLQFEETQEEIILRHERQRDLLQSWENMQDLWTQDRVLLSRFLEDLSSIHSLHYGLLNLKRLLIKANWSMRAIDANVELMRDPHRLGIGLDKAQALQVEALTLLTELKTKITRVEDLLREANCLDILKKSNDLETEVFGRNGYVKAFLKAQNKLHRFTKSSIDEVEDDDDDASTTFIKRLYQRSQNELRMAIDTCFEAALRTSLAQYIPLEQNPNFAIASDLAEKSRLRVKERPDEDDFYRDYTQTFWPNLVQLVSESQNLLKRS